jgi:hypothetical protein
MKSDDSAQTQINEEAKQMNMMSQFDIIDEEK